MTTHNQFSNKKVLFFSPEFYDYHVLIQKEMEKMGMEVDFFPDRPYDRVFKVIHLLFPKLTNAYTQRFHKKILRQVKGKHYDFLFAIKGSSFSSTFLDELYATTTIEKKIMYQWDSIKSHDYTSIIDKFDISYSFDYEDSERFSQLYYKSNFFIVGRLSNFNPTPKDIDILFFGSFMVERYQLLKELVRICESKNLKLVHHLYISRIVFFKLKLKGLDLDKKYLKFNLLPMKSIDALCERAKVICDLSSSNQTGLSIRVMEAIASETKLMTANPHITREQFFNRNNIYIYDPAHLDFPDEFIRDAYVRDLEADVAISNSKINKWVADFFK